MKTTVQLLQVNTYIMFVRIYCGLRDHGRISGHLMDVIFELVECFTQRDKHL